MLPCDYVATDGTIVRFDLKSATGVVRGSSGIKRSWTATVVFVPATAAFVELRSSPQDIRGNSEGEAQEVSPTYLQSTFGLNELQLASIKQRPTDWRIIDLLSRA